MPRSHARLCVTGALLLLLSQSTSVQSVTSSRTSDSLPQQAASYHMPRSAGVLMHGGAQYYIRCDFIKFLIFLFFSLFFSYETCIILANPSLSI